LHRQGLSISTIARRLHLTRPTVRKLVRAAPCPEPAPRPSILTPYEPYLWARWTQGCQNAATLWQEIRALGYPGSYPHVRHALRRWRTSPPHRFLSRSQPSGSSHRGRRRGYYSGSRTTWRPTNARSWPTASGHAMRCGASRRWPKSSAG